MNFIRNLFLVLLLLPLLLTAQTSNRVIFKVKAEHRLKCQKSSISIPSLQSIVQEENIQITKAFPNHKPLDQKSLKEGWTDLSTIYYASVSSNSNAYELIKKLSKDPHILYAEEEVENFLCYQPNDTLTYLQWYLDAVRAYDAWDIEQGDSSVVIAITDTGSDTDHPDLEDNLYKNWEDPINGVDDDNDGYIDNFYGWDTGVNDHTVDPETHAGSSHGTNVAGIASATTDNTTMFAGCGFNSRVMTVKIDNPAGSLPGAYSGVVYAVDQGVKIVNCSWGSYTFSKFGQDIVNYAAINNDALLLCGAGNGPFGGPGAGTGVEDRFYPAAYENAFAVGAIDTGDIVKQSSNFGYWLDIFAPGERMWTTTGGGNIGRNGGTSMAAPVVAAAAALIKAQKPNFSRKQIEERIINSAINIDGSNESKYAGKLGPGKVDFLNALADTNKPGIRFEQIVIESRGNDSILISGSFVNYLKASSSSTVKLVGLSSSLSPLVDQKSIPALNTNGSYSNEFSPFVFRIAADHPVEERLDFKLEITATNYRKDQHFSGFLNADFLDLNNANISISLGSNGSIGYVGPSSSLGRGFRFKEGFTQLFESSFLIGMDTNYVADAFRGNTGVDADFRSISLIKEFNSPRARTAANSVFTDGGISSPVLFEIAQNNYLYDSSFTDQAVIFNYQIKNISGSSQSNIYAGQISDWDIKDFENNRVFYDSAYHMGVSYSTDSSLYIGMSVISHPKLANHYAIDNDNDGQGGVNLSGGFTTAEKFEVLSSRRDSAGFHKMNGEDILDAISIGPFDLEIDSSISLTFAWVVGENLNELREAVDSARSIFQNLPIGIEEKNEEVGYKLFPNPARDILNVVIDHPNSESLSVQIFDLSGRLQRESLVNPSNRKQQIIKLDLSSLKSGVYLLRIAGDKTNIQDKFVVSSN